VPYTIIITTVDNLYFDTTYSFYITSLSNVTESAPSNSLSATTLHLYPPTNVSATGGCGSVTLTWTQSIGTCTENYNIYDAANDTLVASVPYTDNFYTVFDLNFDTYYSFYLTSYNNGFNSEHSNTSNSVKTTTLTIPSISIGGYTNAPAVILDLSYNINGCTTYPYSYNLYYSYK
jgi:hypothetical protein